MGKLLLGPSLAYAHRMTPKGGHWRTLMLLIINKGTSRGLPHAEKTFLWIPCPGLAVHAVQNPDPTWDHPFVNNQSCQKKLVSIVGSGPGLLTAYQRFSAWPFLVVARYHSTDLPSRELPPSFYLYRQHSVMSPQQEGFACCISI